MMFLDVVVEEVRTKKLVFGNQDVGVMLVENQLYLIIKMGFLEPLE